jgi:hypothetical protein
VRDNTALFLFVVALLIILAVLVLHAEPVGEPEAPVMTIEDAEAVPYVSR